MEAKNILNVTTRVGFREWLENNHDKEKDCWLVIKRGKNPPSDCVWYPDAVEEAICFGWIDATLKNIDGRSVQRFMPRSLSSGWTELNKERARRMERLGLMTEDGRKVLPDMSEDAFSIDSEILSAFQGNPVAWENFLSFPPLYQRIRIDSIQYYKKDRALFERRLKKLIEKSEKGEMFGEWNDRGRLIES